MSFEEQLVLKINEFRKNPKAYAKKINDLLPYFKGKNLKPPKSVHGIKTEEGASAYIEAAEFLSRQDGVDPLEPSKGLARICLDFMEKAKNIEPSELNNIDLEEIIAKYGSFSGNLNRAMDFGGEDPEQVLINLLVCDGDPNRGNREALLASDLKKIGIANSQHTSFRYCTLVISCTKFKNKVDSDDYGFVGGTYPSQKSETGDGSGKAKDDAPQDNGPKRVISEKRSEQIVEENGKKKKIVKILREMSDGSKETETIKEAVEDE